MTRKPKPVQQLSPRELRARAPKPASELPYQRLMVELRRKFEALVMEELKLPRVHADAFVPNRPDEQYRLQFANLELQVGKLTDEAALGAKLKSIADGVQEHVKGQLKGVNVITRSAKQETQAREFVHKNVSLIKKMTSEQLSRIKNLTSESVEAQWTQAELAAKVKEDFGFSKARSRLIARDQTLKMNAQATEQLHKDVGVTRYRWVTSHDERVRGTPGGKWPKGTHYELDGQMFDYAHPPVVDKKTGRRSNPGHDFQCRCSAVPDTDSLLFAE